MHASMLRVGIIGLAICVSFSPSPSRGESPAKVAKQKICAGEFYRMSNATRAGHVAVLNENGALFDLDLTTLAVVPVYDYKSYKEIVNAALSLSEDGKSLAVFRPDIGLLEILEREAASWRIKHATNLVTGWAYGGVHLPAASPAAFYVEVFNPKPDSPDIAFRLVKWTYTAEKPEEIPRAVIPTQFILGVSGDDLGERIVVAGFQATWVVDLKNDEIKEYPLGGLLQVSPDKKRISIVGPATIGLKQTPGMLLVGDLNGKVVSEIKPGGAFFFSADSQSLIKLTEDHRLARFGFDGKQIGEAGEPIPGAKCIYPTSAARCVTIVENEGLWAVETTIPGAAMK